ncbi:methylthioribulose 1-phosphate dehydratase [Vitiosangium sp. GDMCC 1.1324]|uniref:methylthioribulose 1-phosphate dehydratase n=1 Tax=Vitiosangium sp. (strain GDMCC 1.1324) TaxID=2138576 RepID=UPI000D33A0C2|nr:methylthioribulose 1-phosphate dehydratase [Vitiosangium sp. GDMCC 1.1324]PTL84645.1 methylthioribulose 1-phosphate dehydratase [Vitiosangium sp. GDMCC 1.1324]
MYRTEDLNARVDELIRAGRLFFERGWVPATAGNFSARLDESHLVITASGRHKGELDADGFLLMGLEGEVLSPGRKPSAETALHLQLYRREPSVGAVLHTHSLTATLLSRLSRGALVLEGYEVLKALPGVDTHEVRVEVPIFANDQDIPRLAARVDAHMSEHPGLHGYLIEGHGLYTWGRTVADARRHMEAFEFLFQCELEMRRLTR